MTLTMKCSSVIQTAVRGNHCSVPRQVISADANIPAKAPDATKARQPCKMLMHGRIGTHVRPPDANLT